MERFVTEAVIIQLHPLPGKYTELAVLVKKMVEAARGFPECQQAETLLAPDRDEISVFQRWTCAEAFSEYLIWRSRQEDLTLAFALSSKEPDFRSFTLHDPG
ncbi:MULTISPECIES: antibiotic biosynthesis monooxygenase [unclassified Leisingera]|uniref:antibiotic biosynthesis monooxygenase n=1 Tax=unclassified Leisingera TaxID=2614906 RepID=UPI0021A8C744|nr:MULTISPECIES: antibiotic biosynthesis monooxygenase [unclassified Leisingera]UWQ76468.1 antibiotic biosynthesis monooxygenase [Leisingera sp. M658]